MTTRAYTTRVLVVGPLIAFAAVGLAVVVSHRIEVPAPIYLALLLIVPAAFGARLGASTAMRPSVTVLASLGASLLAFTAAVVLLLIALSQLEWDL